jgi:putative ABC transport system permease protein
VSRARVFMEVVPDGVRRVPGVDRVALVSGLPFSGYQTWFQPVIARDTTTSAGAAQTWVSDGYFEAMSIRLRAGRVFTRGDLASSRRVVVISQSLARSLWPAGEAVGREIAFDPGPSVRNLPEWAEIIGVVDDVLPVPGRGGEPSLMYRPIGIERWNGPFSRSGVMLVRGQASRSRHWSGG